MKVGDLLVGIELDNASELASDVQAACNAASGEVSVTADTSSARVGLDSLAEGSDSVASSTAQAAGGIGDIGGALAANGIISESTAGSFDLASQSIMGLTGAADILNLGFEKLLPKILATKVGMIAQTAVTWLTTTATMALGAAMAFLTSPIGIIILAIVAVIAILVLLYKKNDTVRAVIDAAWAGIKAAIMTVVDWFKSYVPPIFEFIKKAISLYVNAYLTVITTVFNAIKAIIKTVIEWVQPKVEDAFNAIKTTITKVMDSVESIVTSVWDTVKTTFTSSLTWIVDTIKDIPDDIIALGKDFLAAGEAIIGKLIEGLKGAAGLVSDIAGNIWDAVKGLINDGIDSINSALEFKINLPFGKSVSIDPPDIPHLAKGGIVTQPTLALIGEAGPEAVVPLGRGGMDARGTASAAPSPMVVIENVNNYENVDVATLVQRLDFWVTTSGRVR